MSVADPHPLYKDRLDQWQRCRDAYDGEDAVKGRGQHYLPLIDPTQDGAQYVAYRKRAHYYEATARTVDGFVGAIARKPNVYELPSALEPFLIDATMDGFGLDELTKQLSTETMLIGRGGVLVDFDEAAKRAYLSVYTAESIINWCETFTVLSETVYEPDPADKFKQIAIQQMRELSLDNGVYTVTLWRKNGGTIDADKWVVHESSVPSMRGASLPDIPFYWFSSAGQTNRIVKPPLLGLVNTALSHYRSSADLEHGRHFTALPTLWITGTDANDDIKIGGGSVIVLGKPEAKVGYAEFKGDGLGSLERALEHKEGQMAALGAAIFAPLRKGVEAAETARIRTSGENSLLMSVVAAVEETLEAALKRAAEWMGAGGESVNVQINRDFVDITLDAQTLVGLVQAFQAGAITLEMFLYSLSAAEMLPPETDINEVANKLRAAGPPELPSAPAPANDKPTPKPGR